MYGLLQLDLLVYKRAVVSNRYIDKSASFNKFTAIKNIKYDKK